MSLVYRTIESFPRGRTTEELLVLTGAGFSHDKRLAALAELNELLRDGRIEKAHDGKWRAVTRLPGRITTTPLQFEYRLQDVQSEELVASPAHFQHCCRQVNAIPDIVEDEDRRRLDHRAVLRYWRSALRADPRGATTQVADKHGVEWTLVSGRGPVAPAEGETLTLTVALDALPASFREAIVRREGNENALAIGWPLAVTRSRGMPTFQPVGLLSASWERRETNLVLHVDADDVLVNPDWLRSAAGLTGWNRSALQALFDTEREVGLRAPDFLAKLKDAVASQIRGRLTGHDLASRLDISSTGLFDAAALFLPTDSSFTAGAARDLDAIAEWPTERVARTALAPIFGLDPQSDVPDVPAINVGPLNAEQTDAVRNACHARLSVVTGPPGTGKSQAIVSLAASVLLSGGSVLVASKNHQALDAVEDRLSALAPDAPFAIRTLKPDDDVDVGFAETLKALLTQDGPGRGEIDDLALSDLTVLACDRGNAIDGMRRRAVLECEIGDLLERIAFRESRGRAEEIVEVPEQRQSRLRAALAAILRILTLRRQDILSSKNGSPAAPSLVELRKRLKQARQERDGLPDAGDPIALGEKAQTLVKTLLPATMAGRTFLTDDRRRSIAQIHDDWSFSDGKGHLPFDLASAVLSHRPLWLASILGTPKRIPLEDGLFDLVIFDEASQCDIATAIPLFARAKRAVVVGDDQQLSFIAQLGQAQDRNLMQAQDLPLTKMARFAQSKRSLFDFAARVPNAPRVALRHQYRSAGPIVDYISDYFYSGQLQTSYDPAGLVVPKNAKPGLAWQDVPAPALAQNSNVNPAEVAAVVAHLQLLLEEQGYEGSIGVITPFRAQVMALEQAAAKIPQHKRVAAELKIGTVDGFQGQERDLILFSPCIGPRSPQSGLTFFQKNTRRLNVAISRARAVAMIFGDLEFARSGRSKALASLAARATEPRVRSGEGVFDSDWERRVYHALKARGLDPHPQHEIAGRRLDFALFGKDGVKLDLEVDGRRWHQTQDGRRKTSDIWRDHQLKSAGWRVRRFWVDELAQDMEGCIDVVERDLA
ncbi:AAA domain-containing protein [uncultured Jannaschia sp.]|uniref:AAA domain-containing protein n=1 Tax=uncultured Jannaschia sp. TaxID=293347 RepID=UPI00261ECC43|nr:AAA domain-containing protein [uncultured Jannaschia sp.]